MIPRFFRFVVIVCAGLAPALRAETPPLLATAFERWATGREDLAFTQQTRFFTDDGKVKTERIERYDPSLPDSRRWRLIEVDGKPATEAQRVKWETRKNGKPRKKVIKAPSGYLDLENATLVDDAPGSARFEIGLRRDAARLLGVEKLFAVVTVDKESGSFTHITAALRQPTRVLLGLAKITDLDVDVRVEPVENDSPLNSGQVQTGSTAHIAMSELGNPVEYNWSDFKRVTSFGKTPKPD